jgi:hypothetical protein
MAPNLTLRRLESVPLGVIYARRREAIGSGLSCGDEALDLIR